MKLRFIALPAAMLLAGAAMAQTTESDAVKKDGDPTVVGTPANPVQGPDTPAEAQTATPPAVTAPESATTTSVAPTPAPTTATTPAPTRLYAAPGSAAAGATVVANAPIPDTPENRAKFGGPNSRAGQLTEPAGN